MMAGFQMRALLLTVFLSIPASLLAMENPVEAAVDSEAGLCSLSGTETQSRLSPLGNDEWSWQPRVGDVVRCDGGGLEPLDLSYSAVLDQHPQPVVVAPLPARRIGVTGVEVGETTVEWREEADEGGSRLLATRTLRSDAIDVARMERLLRFRRGDQSPQTVFVRAGSTSPELSLSPYVDGGELFVAFPDHRFLPASLIVESMGRRQTVPVEGQRLSVSGLPPGSHRLILEYRGGVRGDDQIFSIEEGETTELMPIEIEPVGALDLALESGLCRSAASGHVMELQEVVQTDAEVVALTATWRASADACYWWIEGVTAGSYQVTLRKLDTGSAAAWAEIAVEGHHVATVVLGSELVGVTGRVTVGEDHPVVGATVRYSQGTREAEATTDANGGYSLTVPEPGDYTVWVNSTRFFPAIERRVVLSPGWQEQDFELAGGALEVTVRREDGAELEEPVQLAVYPAAGGGPVSGFLMPDEVGPQTLFGLAFDSYRVMAHTLSGWRSRDTIEIELSEHWPVASAEVVLSRSRTTLRLVDPEGRSVSGAEVWVGPTLARESDPGFFDLRGGAAGVTLRIWPPPGFAPQCRLHSGEPELVVVLQAAVGSALMILPIGVEPPRGVEVEGLPGSQCSLTASPRSIRFVEVDDHLAVEVGDLPAGELLLKPFGYGSVPVSVPGPPVWISPPRGD